MSSGTPSSKSLLMRYIRTVVEAHLARVPNQLVSEPSDGEREEDEAVDEFAAVGGGGIAGYTAPLGMDPDRLGRKKNAGKKK
jgi:hypothetical protein